MQQAKPCPCRPKPFHVTGGEHREFVMASGEMTDAQFLDFNQNRNQRQECEYALKPKVILETLI